MCCQLCFHWVHKKCIGKFSKKGGTFEEMNSFYKNKDWFCFRCSRSIFPFMSLCDEDFLIACNGLDKRSMNNNLKNIQNKLSEMNFFQKLLMKKTVILTNLIQIKILLLKTIVNMFLIQTQTNQK